MAIKKRKFYPNKVSAKLHGITEENFNLLLNKQMGLCLICGIILNPIGRSAASAAVDHCHISLEIRGILCFKCNKGLGHFNDDPVILQKAAEYVTSHRSSSVWWKLFRKIS